MWKESGFELLLQIGVDGWLRLKNEVPVGELECRSSNGLRGD
jgi:hypothetical protein